MAYFDEEKPYWLVLLLTSQEFGLTFGDWELTPEKEKEFRESSIEEKPGMVLAAFVQVHPEIETEFDILGALEQYDVDAVEKCRFYRILDYAKKLCMGEDEDDEEGPEYFRPIDDEDESVNPSTWVDLNSSLLVRAGYKTGHAGILTLDFRNGHSYLFRPVSPECWERLLNAESPGKFYHKAIKGKFYWRKLS